MPAAAVIPAPRAYTIIASVKTPVVCHWVQVCWVAGSGCGLVGVSPWPGPPGAGSKPPAVCPGPASLENTGEMLLLQASFTGGPGGNAPHAGTGCASPWAVCPGPQFAVDAAHHRSPPDLDTLENSVCSKRPAAMAGCSSMECHSIDLVWLSVCAGLGAHPGQCGAWFWTGWGVMQVRLMLTPKVSANLVLTGDDGTNQGERYGNARGEILRPFPDPRERWRSAGLGSSIKDESLGNEDDQTPS